MFLTLVAVGTVRLSSIFSTIFFEAPTMGFASEPVGTAVATGSAFFVSAGTALLAGASAAGDGIGAVPFEVSAMASAKYVRQASSTDCGSA